MQRPGLFAFLLMLTACGQPDTPGLGGSKKATAGEDEIHTAVIVLKRPRLEGLKSIRRHIHNLGGQVSLILPPTVLVAQVSDDMAHHIRNHETVRAVSFRPLLPSSIEAVDNKSIVAVEAANRILRREREGNDEDPPLVSEALVGPAFPGQTPPSPQIPFPRLHPQSLDEKKVFDELYANDWHQHQGERALKLLHRHGYEDCAEILENPLPTFGRASGADFFKTSLYLAKDVAVSLFFEPSSEGPWTLDEVNAVYQSAALALDHLSKRLPQAEAVFYLAREVSETTLHAVPSSEGEGQRVYANDLRNTYNTHWSYLIVARRGKSIAHAHHHGPALIVYNQDLRGGGTIEHETGHIFGADDSHGQTPVGPTALSGYLRVVNANSAYRDGTGFFSGYGEAQRDLMSIAGLDSPLTVYSQGQLGAYDRDGDGIFDILDTIPMSEITRIDHGDGITVEGRASVRSHANEVRLGQENNAALGITGVSVHTIESVAFRINGLAWSESTPIDGHFDSGEEAFRIKLPSLGPGVYTLETRAKNSIGNQEIRFPSVEFEVAESSTAPSGAAPFIDLGCAPSMGSIFSVFSLDASKTRDLEDQVDELSFDWRFGSGAQILSEGSHAKVQYNSPGRKQVAIEVTDRDGNVASRDCTLLVTGHPLPPVPSFVLTYDASLDNSHNDFPVKVDASATHDPDTPLESISIRWKWDRAPWSDWAPFLDAQKQTHLFSMPEKSRVFRVELQARDADGQVSKVVARDAWSVAYDHAPSIDGFDAFTGPRVTLSSTVSFHELRTEGFTVKGRYAYAISDGLQVFDLLDPAHPVALESGYNPPDRKFSRPPRIDDRVGVEVIDRFRLNVLDLRTPKKPVLASTIPVNLASGIRVKDNRLYFVDSGQLNMVDLRNPQKPVELGRHPIPERPVDVVVQGELAYFQFSEHLDVFDVGTPDSIRLLQKHNLQEDSISWVRGHLYALSQAHGLRVYALDKKGGLHEVSQYPLHGRYAWLQGLSTEEDTFGVVVEDDHGRWLERINVEAPSRPLYLGRMPLPGIIWDLAIHKNHVYLLDATGLHVRALSEQPTQEIYVGRAQVRDPDFKTTWDGFLAVRWDYDGDGHWDTTYDDPNGQHTFELSTKTQPWLVKGQVRDRFLKTHTHTVPIDQVVSLSVPDADHDGIPSIWEVSHGLDPLDGQDSLRDRDKNGQSNLIEWLKAAPRTSFLSNEPFVLRRADQSQIRTVLYDAGVVTEVEHDDLGAPFKAKRYFPDGTEEAYKKVAIVHTSSALNGRTRMKVGLRLHPGEVVITGYAIASSRPNGDVLAERFLIIGTPDSL